MKTTYTPFEVTTVNRRTAGERFYKSYALLRVAIARIMRGDKPRFKTLFR